MEWRSLVQQQKNFVFIGEAGCGKSEIAVNLACALLEQKERKVHFFDLDMTKPLFRSRDLKEELEAMGIIVHFEEQFKDAPTVTGGVMQLLRDPNAYVVMDVGGDYIGARSIGGYASVLNAPGTIVYYIINNYRAWSMDIDHIDKVLAEVLNVSHIRLENIQLISNCNLGIHTTAQDVLSGRQKVLDTVGPYKDIAFHCVWDRLFPEVQSHGDWLPVKLNLTYPWERDHQQLPLSTC